MPHEAAVKKCLTMTNRGGNEGLDSVECRAPDPRGIAELGVEADNFATEPRFTRGFVLYALALTHRNWSRIQVWPQSLARHASALDRRLEMLQGDAPLGPPPDRLDADPKTFRGLHRSAHVFDGQMGRFALCFFHRVEVIPTIMCSNK